MPGHPYFTWTNAGAAPPPPPVVSSEPTRYPGGHPFLHPAFAGRPRRKKLPQEILEVIQQVAQTQVSRLETDKHKQFEELERELESRAITWEKRYLVALQQEREYLVEQEIGRILRKKLHDDEEEAVIALLMAVL